MSNSWKYPPSMIEKVLALLNAHIGWALKDISQLEIGD